MSFIVDTSYGIDATIAGAAIIGFVIANLLRGDIAKRTQLVMEQNRSALEEKIKILQEAHDENIKRIGDLEDSRDELEHEIKIIKQIPLQELASNYKLISEHLTAIFETQNKILSTQNVLLAAVGKDNHAGSTVNINPVAVK